MSRSELQEPFLREYAATFLATRDRLVRRLADAPASDAPAIIEEELRGLYHGLLVIFDGGSALADNGLVSIADEESKPFDRYLHEICFQYWPSRTS
jgi:molecular chaperone GrpE (heat shock protein)